MLRLAAMYEFTPADPTKERPGNKNPLTHKRKIIFVYIPLLTFVTMMVDILAAESDFARITGIIAAIILNVLALIWAKIDAEERQYELSRHFTLAVVIFGILAIIYYLIRSRGPADGLISTGRMILYAVALVVVMAVAGAVITVILVLAGVLPQSFLDA